MTSYSEPHYSPEEITSLEKFRQQMAEGLARLELALAPPPPKFLGVKVSRPGDDEKGIRCIASVDLSIGPTRVQKEMVEALKLQPANRKFSEVLPTGEPLLIPLYQAKITYGAREFIVDVLPTEMGLPCVVGGEFIQNAVGNRVELVYELLDREHWRALRNAARCKKKIVLILGKYGENVGRLRKVQVELAKAGYEGVILQDFPDIEEQSLPEKMILFASIARFVLCDDTFPSGHVIELKICADIRFTTAILRPQGQAATAMQADIAENCDYMRAFPYTEATFVDSIRTSIEWAEEKVQERSATFDQTYSWRTPETLLK
jgi:hypothetical protein